MLKYRVLSSLALTLVLFVFISIDWLCGLMITAFIVVALYEFFKMLEKKGINTYKYFGIGLGTVIPLSLIYRFELTRNWEFLFIVLGLLSLFLMQFRRRDNSGVIVDISTTIFGIIYVSWFLSFLIRVRYFYAGAGLLVAVLLITKAGDVGAYLVGRRFGRTPLMPRVSPNKSLEGAVGGLFCSIIVAFVCKPLLGLGYAHLVFVGFIMGVLGQLGDLSESLIKRDCQVKDSGKILPGMGGVLDFVDSLLFTGPVFYFYVSALLRIQ
ncbi:MAG: phosphatidate cytidylyltransferase [Candidatus Omnitrophota bacterium]|jgi:phosphatidate cytidylyltransferase|nr:MAG: phosphatidate cytidylyltransferase [Candidatus Omnitrophota bacterium]